MAIMRGCDGELKIGTAKAGYIDSFDLAINNGIADVSSIGKEWTESMETNKSFSGSCSGTLDTSDPAQAKLLDALLESSEEELTIELKVAANVKLSGKIKASGASINATHGDKVSVSFNYTGSGALTKSAITA